MKINTALTLTQSDIFSAIQLFLEAKGYNPNDVCSFSLEIPRDGERHIVVSLAEKEVK